MLRWPISSPTSPRASSDAARTFLRLRPRAAGDDAARCGMHRAAGRFVSSRFAPRLVLLADADRAAGRGLVRADRVPRGADAGPRQDVCRRRARRRAPVLQLCLGVADALLFAQLPRSARALPRRDLRADTDSTAGNHSDDLGRKFRPALSRTGADVAVALRHGRAAARIGPRG